MLSIWSVCLVFCDCVFHSICSLRDNGKGLLKLPDGNCGENGLVLMGRALLRKSLIQLSNFLLMDGAVFPPSCLIWDQTVVEIMKIMATSFKRSCACIATFSISDFAAGYCQSTPLLKLLDTHRQVWVSLLWGHCPFLLGLGAHKVLFVPSKSLFPHSCVSSGGSIVGLMATSSKSAPGLCHPGSLPLWQATADLHLHRRHSNTQSHVWLSLCGVSCCTQVFVWPLWVSLAGMRFDSKCNFAPPTIFWRLILCLCIGVSFFGGIQHSPDDGCSAASCKFEVLNWCQMKNNTFLKYDHEYYHYFMYLLISHHQ